MTAVLRRCGAAVEAASSVHNACGVLDARLPDILVTDIAMPGEDGYDLLHYLQAHNGSAARVQVVALTAFGHPTADAELRAAGFDAYVRKPVDPLHFARVIAALPQPA
jgi:CheY-like chemotaxis protein